MRDFRVQTCLPGVVQAGAGRAPRAASGQTVEVRLASADFPLLCLLCFSCPMACRFIKMVMMFILLLLAAPRFDYWYIWITVELNNKVSLGSFPGSLSVEVETPQCQIDHMHFLKKHICVKWNVIRGLTASSLELNSSWDSSHVLLRVVCHFSVER